MAELSTLARPYAKAAFEYALESNQLQAWSNMLTLTAAVSEQEKVAELLASPEATSSQLADTFVKVCGDQLDQKGLANSGWTDKQYIVFYLSDGSFGLHGVVKGISCPVEMGAYLSG